MFMLCNVWTHVFITSTLIESEKITPVLNIHMCIVLRFLFALVQLTDPSSILKQYSYLIEQIWINTLHYSNLGNLILNKKLNRFYLNIESFVISIFSIIIMSRILILKASQTQVQLQSKTQHGEKRQQSFCLVKESTTNIDETESKTSHERHIQSVCEKIHILCITLQACFFQLYQFSARSYIH